MTDEADDLAVDFLGGAFGYRLRAGVGRRQPLPRAAGFASGATPTVADATAGLGRDAFMLATLGAQVTLFERAPEVFALLSAALERVRAAGAPEAEIVARMTLVAGDARDHLSALQPDVVIVDPMHPPRKKSALVKKEMRLLRDIVGADADAADLLRAALSAARRRVVLKWPLRAAALPDAPNPTHRILGKTVRYDVFVTGGPTR
jgi:16S rRNA (guanine1516-N2)-methyltransferase